MPSLYESNDDAPAVRIPHYPARTPQPHLGHVDEPAAPTPNIDLSYDELIITAAVDLLEEDDSEAG